jgi:protein-S-isoprenylcysteine O-methyltransferase Ste14
MNKIVGAIVLCPLLISISLPPNRVEKCDKIKDEGAPEFVFNQMPIIGMIMIIAQTFLFSYFCYQNSYHNWDFIDSISFISVIVGAGLRKWSFITLGRFFTYQSPIRRNHRLVKTGPYQYLRHPSHTGLGLCVLGITWFLLNPKNYSSMPLLELFFRVYCWFVTLAFPLVLYVRISGEGMMLEKEFGKEWQEY